MKRAPVASRGPAWHPVPSRPKLLWAGWALAIVLLAGAVAGFLLLRPSKSPEPRSGAAGASSGSAQPAFTRVVGKEAPGFTLLDQFGHLRRMSSFRGKAVLLTFVSSRCTDVCPLTALLLRRTQELLGSRSRETQLVAVNANPRYTAVRDVLRWSRRHLMTHRWLFLTGPPMGSARQITGLDSVWNAYGVTSGGAHTTVIFLIDSRGLVRNVVPVAGKRSLDAEARALARYMTAVVEQRV